MAEDHVAEWKKSLAANLRGNWEAAECVVQIARAVAREALEAERARAETAEAALAKLRERYPEPDGVVEEPPRDNAITDAW